MKKIGFLFLFIIFSSATYSQQFLWSTIENNSSKHVAPDDVTDEVITFFDHYKFYHDGAGYTKNSFLKEIEKYGDKSENWKDFKQAILKSDTLSVFAMRSNTGKGSVVLVICVTKENVNFVSFSNNYNIGNQSVIHIQSERKKFADWFQTLLN